MNDISVPHPTSPPLTGSGSIAGPTNPLPCGWLPNSGSSCVFSKGTQEKMADITIFSRDLFETPPEEWHEVDVEMTVVNGEIVYRK